jgi:hypothetical protein
MQQTEAAIKDAITTKVAATKKSFCNSSSTRSKISHNREHQ